MKTTLTIKIPVKENDTRESFNFRSYGDDDIEYWYVTTEISQFIHDNLPSFGVMGLNIKIESGGVLEKIRIGELIKNSYSAYTRKPLKKGKNLEFTVVIYTSESDSDTIIKIKDNAYGFTGQQKSIRFNESAIVKDDKNAPGYLGGHGLGVEEFINSVKYINGSVEFKNRKNKGATVYITLKKNGPMNNDKPLEDNKIRIIRPEDYVARPLIPPPVASRETSSPTRSNRSNFGIFSCCCPLSAEEENNVNDIIESNLSHP